MKHRPHSFSGAVLLAVFPALFLMSGGIASATPQTFSGPDGRIVFSSDRSGTAFELYSMKPNGSDVIQLTSSPADTANVWPDWSPDGRFITFGSDRSDPGGNFQIYVMHADGSHLQAVTALSQTTSDGDPAFSPDGTQIAFDRCSIGCGLWVMDSNGHNQRALAGHGRYGNLGPQFSPSGSEIVMWRDHHFGPFVSAIYTMSSKGPKNLQRITPWSLQAGYPDWSPDGRSIVFYSNLIAPHSSIFSVGAGGQGLRQLTDPPSSHNDYTPSYAPLGDRIVFASDRGGAPDIWVMSVDGAHMHDVTPNTANSADIWPDWGVNAG